MPIQKFNGKKIDTNSTDWKSTKPFRGLPETMRNQTKVEISEHRRVEERLGKLNECLLSFETNPDENINRLVALCGEELGATCALYNRLKDGMLHSVGQWNTPPDYISVNKPDGHICYDLIQSGKDDVRLIRDLQKTIYAETDPNVMGYGLKTYIGKTVSFAGTTIGSLCVVYQEDYIPSEDEKKFLGIIASVIGVEEKRKWAEEVLQETELLTSTFTSIQDGISILDNEMNIIRVNPAIEKWYLHTMPLVGKKCYEAYHSRNEPCDVCPSYRTIKTGEAAYEIVPKRGPGGKVIGWLDLYSFPFIDSVTGKTKGVIEYVRHITERKYTEEALRKSEEEAKQLSQENAIVAEIGRIISSTLEIDKVYESFATEVRKVIPFDRMAINLIYPERDAYVAAYIEGKDVAGYRPEDVDPLAGSLTGEIVRTRSSMLIKEEDRDEVTSRFPTLLPFFHAGFRSFISVPLISKDEVIGILHLRSTKPNAYSERDLRLAERVGHQIAGAVANARLFVERKQAEEALRIEQVYLEQLFESAQESIVMTDNNGIVLRVNNEFTNLFRYARDEAIGKSIDDLVVSDDKVLFKEATSITKGVSEGKAISLETMRHRKDGTLIHVSILASPIIMANEQVGTYGIYRDITERKRAEEALRKSEEITRVLFSISNAVNTTVNLDELYRFIHGSLSQIIDLKNFYISLYDHQTQTITFPYAVDEMDEGIFHTLFLQDIESSALTGRVLMTGRPRLVKKEELLTQVRDQEKKVFGNIPEVWLGVPLKVKNEVIGVMATQSYTDPNRYSQRDLDILLSVSDQVALAIERKQAEGALRRSEEEAKRLAQENATVAEIGRIISSTLNIEKVYELFAEEVRKVIPFDRIAINIIYSERDAYASAYIAGKDVAGHRPGDIIPLAGSLTEEVVRTRSSMFIQTDDRDEVVGRFPGLLPNYQTGLPSLIAVPLISKERVIGVLHVQSAKPNAYTEGDLRLAERVGSQIAGAVANAQLFTELKRSEEAIKQERETFFTMLDKAPYGAALIDTDERYLYLNPEFTAITGYTLEDIPTRKEWLQKAYPDPAYRQKAIETWRKKFDYREVERIFSVVCKSSEVRVIEFRPNLLKDGQILLMLSDITERKRSEEALRKSEEITRTLFSISNAVNTTRDLDELYRSIHQSLGRIIDATNFQICLYHKEKDSIVLTYCVDEFDDFPEDFEVTNVTQSKALGAQVIQTGKPVLVKEREYWEGLKGTGYKTLSTPAEIWLGVPLKVKDEVIGAMAVQSYTDPNRFDKRDVDILLSVSDQVALAIDRKRAEEALRRSEEEAKRLVQENAIVAEIGRIISSTLNIDEVYGRFAEEVHKLIPFDRISINTLNREDRIILMAYVFGVEVIDHKQGDVIPFTDPFCGEIITKRSGILIQAEDESELAKRYPILLSTFQAGLRSMMSTPLISKDEVIGILHLRSTKLNAYSERDLRLAERVGSQIAGAVANAQLFTERMRAEKEKTALEEQLRQSQKIEAIGRLAGGVAHDFNNILTVIKGYTQLSLLELKEGDPLKGNLEEIEKSSQRASDLTRQLLAFSRRQILEFKILDMNTILRDLDKMLHRVIGEDIELVYLLSDDLGRIKTDPGQIEQVILNLVVNARDAMPSGGKLTIETANVELDEAYVYAHIDVKPGHYVMLSVSDTGCGMSREVEEHIFEPFFTTKEKGKGTGLGLSTVYGIVKQSEGDIWFYSEPDQGTVFKIYLPRVDEILKEWKEKATVKEFPLGSETILVVEDELQVRDLTVRALQRQGYRVLEASNGDEALRVVKEHTWEKIHLLLTDVVMPGMSGFELAERLRSLHAEIRVLYMSGYTDNAIVRHGILEPGIDYLQKPFSPEVLARKVREVLDK